MTIHPGTADQSLDAAHDYADIPEIRIDFENSIYTVNGVEVGIDALIDDYDPACLTEWGMAVGYNDYPVHYPKAKGALFKAIRDGIVAGMGMVFEYTTRRDTGSSDAYGPLMTAYMGADVNTAPKVGVYMMNTGANLGDEFSVDATSSSSNYNGGTGDDGQMQRIAIGCVIPRPELAFQFNNYWPISLNNAAAATTDEIDYIQFPRPVSRVDFGGAEEYSFSSDDWFLRKIQVLPTPVYSDDMTELAELSAINPPLDAAPATGNIAKDRGGKLWFKFKNFTLIAPAANRLVVALLNAQIASGTAAGAAAVTIDGIEAECVAGFDDTEFWQAVVPTGTNPEVIVQYSARRDWCTCEVFSFETDNTVPYDAKGGQSAVGANVVLSDLAVESGGKVLAAMRAVAADDTAVWTWTGTGTPAQNDFNIYEDTAISSLEVDPSSSSTTPDLTCNAPAGATGAVIVIAVSWAPSTVTDPYYSSDVLLADFDGADAATSFTTEEAAPHALTFVGNAQLDTADKLAGTASLLLDGTGDYVSAADSADWNFAAGAFTFEIGAKFDAYSSGSQTLIGQYQPTGNQRNWMLQRTASSTFVFWISTAGSSGTAKITATFAPGTGWNVFRVSFDGTTYRLFANGKQIGSATSPVTLFNSTGLLTVGARGDGAEAFKGWLDEARITKGVTRNPGLMRYAATAIPEPPAPAIAPENTGLPVITEPTGGAGVGDVLTSTDGTWDNMPTAYSYQWQRRGYTVDASATVVDDDGDTVVDDDAETVVDADGEPVLGAWEDVGTDADNYTVVSGDVGYQFQIIVTASNAAGPGDPATSLSTDAIA